MSTKVPQAMNTKKKTNKSAQEEPQLGVPMQVKEEVYLYPPRWVI